MSSLNIEDLVNNMITAAKSVLRNANLSSELSNSLKTFEDLGKCIANIEASQLLGEITQEDATDLIDMQKDAAKTVLLKEEGIAKVTAEEMVNAALNSISTTVNTALGWALL